MTLYNVFIYMYDDAKCLEDLRQGGFPQMSVTEMRQLPAGGWSPGTAIPLHSWLHEEQSPEDEGRLKAVGNSVFPLQAHFALSILSHMSR